MPIFKRGDKWGVRIYNGSRKIEKLIGKDRRAAELVMKGMEEDRAFARVANKPWTGLDRIQKMDSQITLNEVLEEFIEDNTEDIKGSTVQNIKASFRLHISVQLGDLRVSYISKDKVERFQTYLKRYRGRSGKPLAPVTINTVTSHLYSVLKYCLGKGMIERHPMDEIKKLRCDPRLVDPFTLDELNALLSHSKGPNKAFFTVLAWSGMRPGEAAALKWNDIDFARGEIRISKGIYRKVEGTPKSRSGNRVIPMHPEIRRVLEELKTRPLQSHQGYVLITSRGRPMSHAAHPVWRRVLNRAGVRQRPYGQLRHTWASLALQVGEDPAWVSKMLGHASLATTFRYYARFIPSDTVGKKICSVGSFPSYTKTNSSGLVESVNAQ